jgi:DNA-binding CsgD family transcriptional regulator
MLRPARRGRHPRNLGVSIARRWIYPDGMRERQRSRCRERLESLAEAGLGPDDARRAAIDALRPAVGFERWCWPLTDPDSGLATGGIGELDFWPSLPRLVALEERGDVVRKPALVAGRRASVALSAAAGGDLARSVRWRECLQPYGIGDELMTACRDRNGCWGSLELLRDAADAPFDEQDVRFLHELAPTLGRLLRRGLRAPAAAADDLPPAPATAILDEELRPVSWTSSFRAWLRELPAVGDQLPAAIYELGARATTPREAESGLPSRVRLRTASGHWATIEGAPLEGSDPGRVAITVRAAGADEVFDLLCKTYDLTRRERQVARLALDGLATKQLAAALSISAYTVQDHLQAVFAKAQVRTRGELTSRLSGRGA